MICQDCAWKADAKVPGAAHHENCGCDCQHQDPGAWKGKDETLEGYLANPERSKL